MCSSQISSLGWYWSHFTIPRTTFQYYSHIEIHPVMEKELNGDKKALATAVQMIWVDQPEY